MQGPRGLHSPGPRRRHRLRGYPSVPGLLAAITQRRPTLLHEQNAVMGRANRRLAGHVNAVACAFPVARVQRRDAWPRTPWSSATRCAPTSAPWPTFPIFRRSKAAPIRILVTGGSQGARLLSELMPEAIAKLLEDLRVRLKVQQQTRKESMDGAR